MKDKHFVIALILLILPVSFGGDLSAGSKAAAEMDAANANSRLAAQRRMHAVHGFTAAEMAALLAGSPIGHDHMGQTSGVFVSSFDATKSREDVRCDPGTNETGNREFNSMNADCFAVTGGSANMKSSASGFPMYDSFSGSDTTQHSGAASSGPFGIGAGGGAGGGGNGPISPGPINPNVPISTPEPGTLFLLAGGLVMLGMIARQRTHRETVSSN
jgi:hypothetical protein